MILIHGNQITCDPWVIYYWFLFLFFHEQPGVRRSWWRGPGSFSNWLCERNKILKIRIHLWNNAISYILFNTCIDIDIMGSLIIYTVCKILHQSDKVDLIISWNESEKSWKHLSIRELESYNYKFFVWLKH